MLNTPRTPLAAQKTALATIRRGDDLPARAQQAAADTRITGAAAIRVRLRKHAEVVLHEIGCDLAWTVLSPDERAAVSGSLGAAKLVRTYGDHVAGSTAEAITNAARRELADLLPARVGNTIELVQYGWDVRDKATELFGTDEAAIAELREPIQIDGGTYTRALVYYARACLRLPR